MADFKQVDLNGTILDVKDATARSDISTLTGVVAGKVPDTRKVNNKALSSDITLKAGDIGINAITGMTATDTQGALAELQGDVDTINAKINSGNIANINANSTSTIETLGLIPGPGFYFIAMNTNTTSTNVAAVYTLRRTSSAWAVSPVFEGTHNSAPRIDSNGVLKLNTNTSNHGIKYLIISMD